MVQKHKKFLGKLEEGTFCVYIILDNCFIFYFFNPSNMILSMQTLVFVLFEHHLSCQEK